MYEFQIMPRDFFRSNTYHKRSILLLPLSDINKLNKASELTHLFLDHLTNKRKSNVIYQLRVISHLFGVRSFKFEKTRTFQLIPLVDLFYLLQDKEK